MTDVLPIDPYHNDNVVHRIQEASLPSCSSIPGDRRAQQTLFMGSNASHKVSFSLMDFPCQDHSASVSLHSMFPAFSFLKYIGLIIRIISEC
jgi:hypothetical protein